MASDTSPNAVLAKNLTFQWPTGPLVLEIPSLSVSAGEKVFVYGPSGCGKSTLLGLIAGVLRPCSGELQVLGHSFHELSQSATDRLRAEHIGVIFQTFNLLPFLSVKENILLGIDFSDHRSKKAAEGSATANDMVEQMLERLGLGPDLLSRSVKKLSVGQQQRVAVARALIGSPELVIADEPTSALDANTRERFIHLLTAECDAAASTLIFVSHDKSLAEHFDRHLDLTLVNRVSGPGEALVS